MAGLDGTITICQMRRRAEFTVSPDLAKEVGISEGPHPCYVLGIFQAICCDGAGPVAVCELYDGHVVEIEAYKVQFLDTKRGMVAE